MEPIGPLGALRSTDRWNQVSVDPIEGPLPEHVGAEQPGAVSWASAADRQRARSFSARASFGQGTSPGLARWSESLGGTDVRVTEENTGGGGAADSGSSASGGGAADSGSGESGGGSAGGGAADSGSAADGADEADGDKESDKKEENGNEEKAKGSRPHHKRKHDAGGGASGGGASKLRSSKLIGSACQCQHCKAAGLVCGGFVNSGRHGRCCSLCHNRGRKGSSARCAPSRLQAPGSQPGGSGLQLVPTGSLDVSSLGMESFGARPWPAAPDALALKNLLEHTINNAATAAAAGAANQVGRQWSQASSGAASRLFRKTPSVAGVVIYTDGRNGQDRALAVTLDQLATTLPCISFDSLAGFNGVGARGAGESRSYAEDERNRDSVLEALATSLQHIDAEEYSPPAGIMANWPMSAATFAAGAARCFCKEDMVAESDHYTQTISGGTIGCTASHFFAWASFAQRGLSASDAADSLLVFENDVRVDAQFADQLDHALVTLRSKAENWDLCVFTRGGGAPTGWERSDESERAIGQFGRTTKFVVYQATYMAGTCAYLISKKGAAKLAHSGLYKELICVDDFLNAINELRVGAHMNDEVNTLDSVRKVRGQGFTVYGSVSNLGDADAIVALDSSHTSDTRYPRTGPPPPSTPDETPAAVAPTAAAAPVVAQPAGPAQPRALCIVQGRSTKGKGVEYKIRWEGLGQEHDAWLSPAALPDKMIERFRREFTSTEQWQLESLTGVCDPDLHVARAMVGKRVLLNVVGHGRHHGTIELVKFRLCTPQLQVMFDDGDRKCFSVAQCSKALQ